MKRLLRGLSSWFRDRRRVRDRREAPDGGVRPELEALPGPGDLPQDDHDRGTSGPIAEDPVAHAPEVEETAERRPTPRPPRRIEIIRRPTETLRVTVGLDFGTSATKATWRRQGSGGIRPIDFAPENSGRPVYALPSVARFDADGRLRLGIEAQSSGQTPAGNGLIHHLKVLLAGKHNEAFRDQRLAQDFAERVAGRKIGQGEGLAEEHLTTLLLAHAMVEARRHVLGALSSRGDGVDITYNVGIPIDHRQCDTIWRSWAKAVACAERCARSWESLCRGGLDYDHWREIWSRSDYGHREDDPTSREDQDARAFVIPEAVAAFDAFARSLAARSGLYALVDLGSGTTDLSLIRCGYDRELDWLGVRALPFGCRHLDGGLPGSRSEAEIERHCEQLHQQLKPTWKAAYDKYRSFEDWQFLEVYVTGGGIGYHGLAESFAWPWWWYALRKQSCRFDVKELPLPDGFGGRQVPSERMAVAIGLSMDKPQISVGRLPNEVPDLTPVRPERYDPGNDDGSGLRPRGPWV